MRLLDHLRTLGLSSSAARDALAHGKVLLGGVPVADGGREVDPAQVAHKPDARRVIVGRDPVLLFHDASVAVVWKPSGMLSVPAPRRRDPNVIGFVGQIFGAAFAVHRLDEETSGLILVARTERAQLRLKDQFEAHTTERRYLGLARGVIRAPHTLRSTFIRDRGDGLRGSGEGGKPAVTHVRPLEALRAATLFEAQLETGRTHQVRIHLAEWSHPLLGDPLYGDGRGAPRLALHAAVLAFDHPESKARLRYEAPLADDLEQLRRKLSLTPQPADARRGDAPSDRAHPPRRR